jgi:hypothetical protein
MPFARGDSAPPRGGIFPTREGLPRPARQGAKRLARAPRLSPRRLSGLLALLARLEDAAQATWASTEDGAFALVIPVAK